MLKNNAAEPIAISNFLFSVSHAYEVQINKRKKRPIIKNMLFLIVFFTKDVGSKI
jgi:hypothetical protein